MPKIQYRKFEYFLVFSIFCDGELNISINNDLAFGSDNAVCWSDKTSRVNKSIWALSTVLLFSDIL